MTSRSIGMHNPREKSQHRGGWYSNVNRAVIELVAVVIHPRGRARVCCVLTNQEQIENILDRDCRLALRCRFSAVFADCAGRENADRAEAVGGLAAVLECVNGAIRLWR